MKRLVVLLATLSLLAWSVRHACPGGTTGPGRTADPDGPGRPAQGSTDDGPVARRRRQEQARPEAAHGVGLRRQRDRGGLHDGRGQPGERRRRPRRRARRRDAGRQGRPRRRPDQGPAAAQARRSEERGQRQPRPAEADRPSAGQPGPGHRQRQAEHQGAPRLALSGLAATDVPYADAPPIKGSNFEALKKLDLLDAKTHDFADAWKMGYDGTGVTVSILDGGTDWGHPDLIGTWLTGPSGWPQAYDPYDTLVLLVDPGQVDLGLTWYAPDPAEDRRRRRARASRRSRSPRGPDRRATSARRTARSATTTPTRPPGRSPGKVRLGSHPDDYLLLLYGERPAFLVTDPNVAGVYDTIYVDLNDDDDFGDEKPVTKASPVSYRDLNGDGYTDLSGGLAYYISDGTGPSGTPLPGGPEAFGLEPKFAPGAMVAWTGDFDPAIEGHGTLTASNVVGQGVIDGGAPTFADVHTPDPHLSGRRHRRRAEGQGRPDGRHLLRLRLLDPVRLLPDQQGRHRRDLELVRQHDAGQRRLSTRRARRPPSGARPSASARRPSTRPGNGAPGYGTVNVPAALHRDHRRGVDPVRRHRLGLDQERLADHRQRCHPVVRPRPGRDRRRRHRRRRRRRLLGRRRDPERRSSTARSPGRPGAARAAPRRSSSAPLRSSTRPRRRSVRSPTGSRSRRGRSSSRRRSTSATTRTPRAPARSRRARPSRPRSASGSSSRRTTGVRATTAAPSTTVFPHLLAPGASDSQTFKLDGQGTYGISDRILSRVASPDVQLDLAERQPRRAPNSFNCAGLPDRPHEARSRPIRDADLMVIRAIYPH